MNSKVNKINFSNICGWSEKIVICSSGVNHLTGVEFYCELSATPHFVRFLYSHNVMQNYS